jgi:hypothetical protein
VSRSHDIIAKVRHAMDAERVSEGFRRVVELLLEEYRAAVDFGLKVDAAFHEAEKAKEKGQA